MLNFMLNANHYLYRVFSSPPYLLKWPLLYIYIALKTRSWLHTKQARQRVLSPTWSVPPRVSSPFLISFSTSLELRGCGEWNCQRARNRGVLGQAKCFLYNMQAQWCKHTGKEGRPGQKWEETAPGVQGLAGGSLSLHVYTFCPRLFSRTAQAILGR